MFTEEQKIFYGILTFMIVEFLWELYLSIRQHHVYEHAVRVPNELKDILTHETYEKARIYGLDRCTFSIVKDIFGMVLSVAIMLFDGIPYFWDLSERIISAFGYSSHNEILQSVTFGFILYTFSTIINLPLVVYNTFVLEEKHGFNKQTVGFFVKDKLKSFAVSQVIFTPLLAAMVYIVQIGGKYFFLYLWMFSVVTSVFLLTIYPNYIAPLFDKYTPLPDGELKTKIEQLAASIDFPLYKLYVVEGSKRSTHSNAYFYGFFKNKRIVLFDTLLKDYTPENKSAGEDKSEEQEKSPTGEKKGCDNDEVLAVLGHELGHWKLNHILKNFVIAQLNLLFMFLVFGLMFKYDPMYRAFGFSTERPVIIGLMIVFQYIFSPYNAILGFLLTMLSRKFEFQADAFAKSLGKAKELQRALIKLNQDNLSFPVYDWLFSMWHHSHPPLLERLRAIEYNKTD
ncbi:CAAX prenyl protease 1 homolog [Schistocerca cancellata]|uniref:CAAX prenyl protease 1 homolog n=1 Tax=Schistocerca cancellata TaxID=274614 RepID=UPI0021181F13|nr:CAAX prenyl protease 1 homolog [Schistocerca cancellata]